MLIVLDINIHFQSHRRNDYLDVATSECACVRERESESGLHLSNHNAVSILMGKCQWISKKEMIRDAKSERDGWRERKCACVYL